MIEWLMSPAVLSALLMPGAAAALLSALIIIYLERKLTARAQRRIGPYYVSRRIAGALQPMADGIRFFFQEPVIPISVDIPAFVLAPALVTAVLLVTFSVIPGGPAAVAVESPTSLLIVLAALALSPIPIIIMGWASDNRFSLLGSLREAILNSSYEPVLLLAALAGASVLGTLDLVEAVEVQARLGLPGIILNPLAALVFFVAALAACDRIPFDLVLGEQEIVAGPYTEYSGVLFAVAMAIDYLKLYILGLVFAVLFLGGWLPATSWPWSGIVLFLKALAFMLLAVYLRVVYGRARLDKALRGLWKFYFPLALAALAWGQVVSYIMSLV
ncbi:NADH dehydrogenase (quinone) [Pyrolobus fumarii 1A]|uniref:NADH dehydrogenase (Quinone) n=1 Tax=Pyrolobus fumarii (strain DSM 11204 / 1A) TaxID=694429 RepID=G0EDL2_PYRF1|nr:NADH-quinone oxidoreductase subunit NuoH [Pyrolobus fumarii]AEM39816.1 NADH dehydrogenase (quinone) [Pyrolobus fumarii 1A]